MERIFEISSRLVSSIGTEHYRSLYHQMALVRLNLRNLLVFNFF